MVTGQPVINLLTWVSMVEKCPRTGCSEGVLELRSKFDRTLCDHWDSIHIWRTLLVYSMPMYSYTLIWDFVFHFKDHYIVEANVYWWPRRPLVHGYCSFTFVVYEWSNLEFVRTFLRFNIKFTRSITWIIWKYKNMLF